MAKPETPSHTAKRGGRKAALALVDEVAAWLEVNGKPHLHDPEH